MTVIQLFRQKLDFIDVYECTGVHKICSINLSAKITKPR